MFMRRTAVCLLFFLLMGLCSCAAAPKPAKLIKPTPAPAATPAPTATPVPTRAPSKVTASSSGEKKAVASASSDKKEQKAPYQDPNYPLTPKSLRPEGSTRFPEEKRLNHDPKLFWAEVDLVNQVVKIYKQDAEGEYTVLVREMICSSGVEPTNRSPRGTFKMGKDYKRFAHFVNFGCYGQYWSQIRGSIYFHSITYSERDDRYLNEEDFHMLGQPASHGCIRLLPDDAQWVYLYLCPGTRVTITDEKEKDPALTERLKPTELPVPDCFEYAKK